MFWLKVLALWSKGMCWEWAVQTVALEEIAGRMRRRGVVL